MVQARFTYHLVRDHIRYRTRHALPTTTTNGGPTYSPRCPDNKLYCFDSDEHSFSATAGRFDSCAVGAQMGACEGMHVRDSTTRRLVDLSLQFRHACPSSCGVCNGAVEGFLKPGWHSQALKGGLGGLDSGTGFGDSTDARAESTHRSNDRDGHDTDTNHCDFERVDGREITAREFATKYARARVPVVLTGLMQGWGAVGHWGQGITAPNRANHNLTTVQVFVRDTLARMVLNKRNYYVNLDREPMHIGIRQALRDSYTVPPVFGLDLIGAACYPDLPHRLVGLCYTYTFTAVCKPCK